MTKKKIKFRSLVSFVIFVVVVVVVVLLLFFALFCFLLSTLRDRIEECRQ